MKTICPHCKQEYPETPNEYLGMTLQCQTCHKVFVCMAPQVQHFVAEKINCQMTISLQNTGAAN